MRIEYSPVARRDLDRVWAEVFEASASEETATKYIDDLMNQISAKQNFPKSGAPLYYEGLFTGFYFVTFKSYMAFYKVETDRMLVSRVVYVEPFIRSLFGDENPVTIGMGNVYQDVTMLSKSYLEARAALDYRLVKGKNSCISYSEIEQPAGGEPLYPQALLDDYVHYLHDWDTPRIAKVLDDIIRHIHSCHLPLQQVKCICVEISSAFLREASNFGIKFPWRVGRCFDVFSIAEYDSIIELTQNIQAFSSNIQSYITKQKEMRNQKLIQQCNILMEQNVSNPQFSLSQLSELTGVTSQTLRRKFKDSTGETLSNHLKDLRINRAKKLLLNTDIDLESICIQCGFFNLSSFIRLFKEETGVTPGKYRESQSSKKVISEVQA